MHEDALVLSPEQEEALYSAIIESFDEHELSRVTRFEFRTDLDAITGKGQGINLIAFELITWARKQGRTNDLIRAFLKRRPRNNRFQALGSRLTEEGVPRIPLADYADQGEQETTSELRDGRGDGLSPAERLPTRGPGVRLSDIIRIELPHDSPREVGVVLVDVGLEKVHVRELSHPLYPVYCGCGSARIRAKFTSWYSREDPRFPTLPEKVRSQIQYGIGVETIVRWESDRPRSMIVGRGRICYLVKRLREPRDVNDLDPGQVMIEVMPEWFHVDAPGLPSALKVALDDLLKGLFEAICTQCFPLK
jgi:hypothetical protein